MTERSNDTVRQAVDPALSAAKDLVEAAVLAGTVKPHDVPILLASIYKSLKALERGEMAVPEAATAAPVALAPVALATSRPPRRAASAKTAPSRLAAKGAAKAPPRPAEPAVAIRRSVHQDFIICLEDGSKHQMMKRYLKRVFNLTPEEYRARWGLPDNYPMTAPGYSARKRNEAFAVGLGTHANKQGINVGLVPA